MAINKAVYFCVIPIFCKKAAVFTTFTVFIEEAAKEGKF